MTLFVIIFKFIVITYIIVFIFKLAFRWMLSSGMLKVYNLADEAIKQAQQRQNQSQNGYQQYTPQNEGEVKILTPNAKISNKKFSSDKAEYIDFEEIK